MGRFYGAYISHFYCRAVFGGGEIVVCGGVIIKLIYADVFSIHMGLLKTIGNVTIIVSISFVIFTFKLTGIPFTPPWYSPPPPLYHCTNLDILHGILLVACFLFSCCSFCVYTHPCVHKYPYICVSVWYWHCFTTVSWEYNFFSGLTCKSSVGLRYGSA